MSVTYAKARACKACTTKRYTLEHKTITQEKACKGNRIIIIRLVMTEQMKEALDKAARDLQWSQGSMLIDKKTLKPADPADVPLERLVYLPVPDKLDMAVHFGANWYRNNLWHDASEEPCDMGHCLIYFGGKGKVRYLDFALVFYNKYEKAFITEPYPHPTGYKVEQKSVDGGCSAEVYKYKRDRIPLSDIAKWCYLSDIL